MLIYKIKNNSLETFIFPEDKKGNYWFADKDKNENIINLINVEYKDDKWILNCNYDYDLYYNNEIKKDLLVEKNVFYLLKNRKSSETIMILFTNIYEDLKCYTVGENGSFLIGSDNQCHVTYKSNLIGARQLQLTYANKGWSLSNLNPQVKVYVNNIFLEKASIPNGSVIFVMGLRIIVIGSLVFINNINNLVEVKLPNYDLTPFYSSSIKFVDDDASSIVMDENAYFNRAPRFKSKIETAEMNIENPPEKTNENKDSALLIYGPMLTMSLTSVVMLYTSFSSLGSGEKDLKRALPSIVMGVAFLCSTLLWPLIRRQYTKSKNRKKETLRKEKYTAYLEEKRKELNGHIIQQKQILQENFMPLENCAEIILNKKNKLWERKNTDDDFLEVRLGHGVVPLDIKMSFPTEKFSLEEDELKNLVQDFVKESREIDDAPITVSLVEKRSIGIIGNYVLTSSFVKGLLFQLITYYSSDMVKIVVLTNESNEKNWDCFKIIPHIWNNEKTERYYAVNSDQYKDVAQYLEREYTYREEKYKENETKKQEQNSPYYIIVTDNFNRSNDYNFIKKILNNDVNLGFSVIIINDRLSNLPNECNCFINVSEESSGLIENELVSTNQKIFKAEFPDKINILACCLTLANIPILIEAKAKDLPDSYGLMELYNIGKVEQLNSQIRWKQNNPSLSLATPIGVDKNGDIFKLDAHEKFHGPHGLVAGTTGSGKSEWIITFVLSMAINYSPEEVSFVIIDYKGGGLALAFENKELGIKLPHMAGTITNLDASELNRSLVSIESELKRRQKAFNEARDISQESTIDIYKYQRLYRDGVVKEPISHLFIICDEFAELKSQQPEFMSQLVSTSRIGRSLGVHLILATQKPAGVVNDQIWSNSRFKVCLKVQDKADSNDLIKVPDAAELKQAGRFYLLVGYNEYFALGQAAYCGMPYIPSETIIKKIDTSLTFVDNVGNPIKSIDDLIKTQDNSKKNGEVLLNVVKYLTDVAKNENVLAKQLWLEKIPAIIFVDNLKEKYSYQKEPYIINPVIGEYDNPANQSQHLLTLPLTEQGNALIFGMAGAGKEDLLMSLVYSIVTTYTPEEINLYIIDCGSEVLNTYRNTPQIGEILVASDKDKIFGLFKMIDKIMDKRKEKFLEFGGSLSAYNSYSGKKESTIIVIINNFENFSENYNFDDTLFSMTREGLKYGIAFIISASSDRAIRGKLKQNFNLNISLQMNDDTDYYSILGRSHLMLPAIKGRGFIKLDDIYEFQSASIYDNSILIENVRKIVASLRDMYSQAARKIPILPDIIDINFIKDSIKDLAHVPIGMTKEDLVIKQMDFQNNYLNVITSGNLKDYSSFINGLIQVLKYVSNIDLLVIDTNKIVNEKLTKDLKMENNNYDAVVTDIIEKMDKLYKNYVDNNYDNSAMANEKDTLILVIGMENLLERIKPFTKKAFLDHITKYKGIGKINFVIIENEASVNKFIYDSWFKDNYDRLTGIYLGANLADQKLFKLNRIYRSTEKIETKDFGYIVVGGEASLIKMIQYQDENSTIEIL